MRFAKTICNATCVALLISAVGCATTNKTMQSVVQKFNFSKTGSGDSLASGEESKQDPRVTSLLDDAIASWSNGDMDETRKLLGQAIKRDPRNREARHLMANLLAAEHDYEAAQLHLREALKTAPDDARTHHALAALLEQVGDNQGAAKHLDRAKELDPSLQEMASAEGDAEVLPANFSQKTADFAPSQMPAAAVPGSVKTSFHLGDQ